MYFIDHALATEAARRLKGTEQSVTEMAFDLGFSDQAAFTKFFIRMKGKSPRNYRKNN
jgi:AraC-like DNA-binding protein